MQIETHAPDHPAIAHAPEPQRPLRGRVAQMPPLLDVASNHAGDHFGLASFRQVDRGHEATVAQDGGAIADLEDFVHLVRDVDDRDATRREPFDQLRETVEFRRRQG